MQKLDTFLTHHPPLPGPSNTSHNDLFPFFLLSLAGNLLRFGLESHRRSTGTGPCTSAGPDETGDSVPADLQGDDRGAHFAEGA